ncbi:unnamed protein product [Zymoseptoria tritici ST99CH_3D1]|nr:unnamed protein product [Zymoseptoria tritici ST99CH_3D1]
MPTSEELTDAYVAQLLKRDAERGVSFKRPRSDAPKPNTRFLRNIVRDVDSHNAALKAKEEQEARARLRKLRREDRTRDGRDGKDRQGEDSTRHRGESSGSRRHRSSKTTRDPSDKQPRSKSLSPPKARSPVPCHPSDQDSDSDVLGPEPPPKNPPRGRGAYKNADINARFDPSYDPREDVALEDDGKEVEGGDWDMALEAMRDRAKWRTGGAERLRAAGFTEQEVLNWQGGGTKLQGSAAEGERNVNDLVWTKQGEKRAWDADK